jgi:hypothetical protein
MDEVTFFFIKAEGKKKHFQMEIKTPKLNFTRNLNPKAIENGF